MGVVPRVGGCRCRHREPVPHRYFRAPRQPKCFPHIGSSQPLESPTTREFQRGSRASFRELPEQSRGTQKLTLKAGDRNRCYLDLSQHTVQSANEEPPVSRPLFGKRDPERKVFRRKRLSFLIERRESCRPLLGRHRTSLLEAAAKNDLGRFIVKEQATLRINEKEGDTEVSGELPN